MKKIAILGSTGSIGQNALEVIRHFPKDFSIFALSTNANTDLLLRQIREFHPRYAWVKDTAAGMALEGKIKTAIKLVVGEDGFKEFIGDKRIDKIVMAISGSGALMPLWEAVSRGKTIALANKEALVMAGSLIMQKAKNKNASIIPVDSEQSAIWQCLEGQKQNCLKKIYLTASGGPFLSVTKDKLRRASVASVLKHPRWQMGKKISVDSATLMNKGLEVLEAMYLFGLKPEQIKVLIHPQAIVHSMVEFVDGVLLAQLSATDMRIPIQYALTFPERKSNSLPRLDFYRLEALNFSKPDFSKFPCLSLAYQAAAAAGTMPAVLNAANEVAVEAFLKKKITFLEIPRVIARVLSKHRKIKNPGLGEILEADSWARKEAL